MHELFDTLRGLIKIMPENQEVRRAVLFAAWSRTAGPSVAEHAKAYGIEGKRLIIAVENKTWQRQMVSLAPQFLSKISSAIGSGNIDLIDFQIIPEVFSDVVRRLPTQEAAEAALEKWSTPELIAAADNISDAELRKNFLLAAAGSIDHRKRNGRS